LDFEGALDSDEQTEGVERGQPEIIEVGAERQVGRRNGELGFLTDEALDDGKHFEFPCHY
jgi:hypothetical protein